MSTPVNWIEVFCRIVSNYLGGNISAPNFKNEYMNYWRICRDAEQIHEVNSRCAGVADRIFTTLDCYCSDPLLREPSDLNDDQLFVAVFALYQEAKCCPDVPSSPSAH